MSPKKAVIWLVSWGLLIFVLYAIFTHPDPAASMFGTAWDAVVTGVKNLAEFFNRLISR